MSGVLVIAEHRQRALRPVTAELVTAAAGLKQRCGGPATLALIGGHAGAVAEAAKLAGVDAILVVEGGGEGFQYDFCRAAVQGLIEQHRPSLVLIPHTVDGISYAPALAATGNSGFATDVFALRYEGSDLIATRAAYKEKVHVELDFPGKTTVIVTIRPGTFAPAVGRAEVPVTRAEPPAIPLRTKHHGYVQPEGNGTVDIPSAGFIVAVGRGVGDQGMVEEVAGLAAGMGATLACSRPICDAGWLPKSHQVGQSGRTAVNCKVYLAIGISGAVQHLAGMKHVDTIVAVNKDPDAAIFGVARYGVVADLAEVVEELKNHFA